MGKESQPKAVGLSGYHQCQREEWKCVCAWSWRRTKFSNQRTPYNSSVKWRMERTGEEGDRGLQFSLVTQSSLTLWPHGLQHARTPCPPNPRACSNSCPSSWWCHPTISSSVIPFSHLQSFPASGSSPMSQFFASGGQSIKSFSFNISPSKEHSGLISFRMDCLDFLAVQGTLKSFLKHHSSKASILQHSDCLIVQLWHPYMTTGKTIALTTWTFVGKVCLCFLICSLGWS